jgi:hypothetical protein
VYMRVCVCMRVYVCMLVCRVCVCVCVCVFVLCARLACSPPLDPQDAVLKHTQEKRSARAGRSVRARDHSLRDRRAGISEHGHVRI